MGVKGLYTYVKKYRKDTLYESVPSQPPLRIGFDAMSMLYKYKANYPEMYPMLRELKAAGHSLLFVFDGKPPAERMLKCRSGAISVHRLPRRQRHSKHILPTRESAHRSVQF